MHVCVVCCAGCYIYAVYSVFIFYLRGFRKECTTASLLVCVCRAAPAAVNANRCLVHVIYTHTFFYRLLSFSPLICLFHFPIIIIIFPFFGREELFECFS